MANIVMALGNATWESQFISGLAHPMFDLSVVKRCVDGVDIQATIQAIDVDAVVVTDGVLRVDEHCIAEVLSAGIRFIVITSDVSQWKGLGAIDVIRISDDNFSEMVKQVVALVRNAPTEQSEMDSNIGRVIAVLGFGGASGRSQCALHVAEHLQRISTTCLVDADMYAPSLAQLVGHTEFAGGLLGLSRLAELHKLSELSLHGTTLQLDSGLLFLRGIPTTQRWTDFRIHALRSVWEYIPSMVNFTVIDCGPAYDVVDLQQEVTSRPHRGLAALTALGAADTVIVTAQATDVGITRVIVGIDDVQVLFNEKDVVIVVHGVESEKEEKEIRIALARELGISAIVCIPAKSFDYTHVVDLIAQEKTQPQFAPQNKTARRGIIRKRAA